MGEKTTVEKTFWQKRTKLEKTFLAFLATSSIVFFVEFLQPLYTNENPYCDNTDCIEAAAEILKFVDPSVDPCQDFYSFACGTFAKNAFVNEVPSPIKILSKKAKYQLAEIVMEEEKDEDVNSVRILKKVYESCMDVDSIEEDDGGALLALLENLGGFPVIKQASWEEEKFDWMTYGGKARRNGLDHNVFLYVTKHYDAENGTKPKIIIPHEYKVPLKAELKNDYVNYMADITVLLGASRYWAFNEMRKVMHFEDQLKKAVEIAQYASDGTDNIEMVTIGELQFRLPQIPWLYYLNNITYPSYTFVEDDLVVFSDYAYVKQLLLLIARTPKRTQANFAIWKTIQPLLIYLKRDIVSRSKNFTLLSRPIRKNDDVERYKFCTYQATRIVPYAAEAAYARKYMTESKIDDIDEMIDNIMDEFEISIKNAEWFDKETKMYALEKLHSMKNYVGCPKEMLNAVEFDRKLAYDSLTLNTSNLIEIHSNLTKHFFDGFYDHLYDNDTSIMTTILKDAIITINAYYVSTENTIFLPAATLQGMFYNENLPKYYNYGALGSIIGHEITHGFSIKSSKYGKTGEEESWWTNSTQEAYLEKIQCVVDDYGNFSTTQVDFELNGTTTLEENYADYVGVKVAYRAYLKSTKNRELPLPGLDLTPNQLFWVTTASYECYKGGSHEKSTFKETDQHAIPHFRINSPLRNTHYFGEDFNCLLGTYMNPVEKCEVL